MQRKRNETIAESTIQNIFSATKQKGIKNRYVEKKKKKNLTDEKPITAKRKRNRGNGIFIDEIRERKRGNEREYLIAWDL